MYGCFNCRCRRRRRRRRRRRAVAVAVVVAVAVAVVVVVAVVVAVAAVVVVVFPRGSQFGVASDCTRRGLYGTGARASGFCNSVVGGQTVCGRLSGVTLKNYFS